MIKKILVVTKYEFLKTVNRKSFWFTTLFMPIFIIILMAVSVFSSVEGGRNLDNLTNQIERILVLDEANILSNPIDTLNIQYVSDFELAKQDLEQNKADLLIYFPEDIVSNYNYQIFTKKVGIFETLGIQAFVESLIQSSALNGISNPTSQFILSTQFSNQFFIFNNTQWELFGIEQFIVPVISLVIFFVSVFISGQYMLQSVAEEKENRMIENLLSIINSQTLIFGKLFGLTLAVFTQLFVWLLLGIAGILIAYFTNNLPINIDYSLITLNSIPLNIAFVMLGFLLFAFIMTGVGSIGSSYKDSQGLSSVFIIIAILPFYLLTLLISDPNGIIAQIFSYIPFTSAMTFVLRNSITELSTLEVIFGLTVNVIYVLIASLLAYKLFNLGSIMYSRKPTLKEILFALKK